LGLVSLFFIDIQSDGHQVVRGSCDGNRPADAGTGTCHNTNVVAIKVVILKN
jgi:hypothetical protein